MRIGIDVGGSHIGLGIIDDKGILLLKEERDYSHYEKDMSNIVIKTIIELLNNIMEEKGITASDIELMGVAFPGTISNGIVVKAENLGIKNLNIKEKLEAEFKIPVYLQNDAKCAAIAEKQIGSLKEYDDALFLVIGTGIGGAVFLDGKLLKPKRYSGFEVGHVIIKSGGEKCNCGRNGCFEVYGSIKRLKGKLQKEFNLGELDGKEIKEFILQNKDNEKLNYMLDTYIQNLASGIASLINIFEPEAVCIGGSFAYYKEILLEKLKEECEKELFNKENPPKILIAELKNDAGIIGSAMV